MTSPDLPPIKKALLPKIHAALNTWFDKDTPFTEAQPVAVKMVVPEVGKLMPAVKTIPATASVSYCRNLNPASTRSVHVVININKNPSEEAIIPKRDMFPEIKALFNQWFKRAKLHTKTLEQILENQPVAPGTVDVVLQDISDTVTSCRFIVYFDVKDKKALRDAMAEMARELDAGPRR